MKRVSLAVTWRPWGAAVALVLAASCGLKSDPNKGRYACTTDADCGSGFTCRAQASGGSLCFKPDECAAAETCNGLDDDCDGQVDQAFPEDGAACSTGRPGRCAPGVTVCVSGALRCQSTQSEQAEACNDLDDNCDGRIDETFDVSRDPLNCGACGRRCAAGTVCRERVCVESACGDTIDNDLNGAADCQDSACFQIECNASVQPAWRCGVRVGTPPSDAGAGDAGPLDAGASDAGGADAGSGDAGANDAGANDAGVSDAGASDAGDGDAGPADAGLDAGVVDGGAADAAVLDAGAADAAVLDAGAADAAVADAGAIDAGRTDAGPLDAGRLDGGATADAGPSVGCFPPEAACGNGFDDDGDGVSDCADPDCDGRACATGVCTDRQCR